MAAPAVGGNVKVTGTLGDYCSLVTGDRSASITASAGLAANLIASSGGVDNLLDGSMTDNNAGAMFFSASFTNTTTAYILFDFGTPKLIRNAKWIQQTGVVGVLACHGTWQWQGSQDNSAFDNIGSQFELGTDDPAKNWVHSGSEHYQMHIELLNNTTYYRYYRLQSITGFTSDNPFIREIEFVQSP